ncbi:hypothetical protein WN944_022301 [Citrus x changshan-huyou]|uniref:Uncharacterized protein n=1 Tax=Citrus x changshan-huyou TaxID=2935761 RepID=A0AAP0N4C9_9ROSI
MEHTLIPALDALNKKDVEGVTNLLRRALQVLLARPVNIVIMASNDTLDLLLRMILYLINASIQWMLWSAVKWVKSVEKAM